MLESTRSIGFVKSLFGVVGNRVKQRKQPLGYKVLDLIAVMIGYLWDFWGTFLTAQNTRRGKTVEIFHSNRCPYLHAVLGEKKKKKKERKLRWGRSSHCSFQLFSSNPDRKPCAERKSTAKIESVALLCGSDLCSHPLGVKLYCFIHPWGPSS